MANEESTRRRELGERKQKLREQCRQLMAEKEVRRHLPSAAPEDLLNLTRQIDGLAQKNGDLGRQMRIFEGAPPAVGPAPLREFARL
jgi:hypothetical protein